MRQETFNVYECADYLGVHYKTIYTMVRSKEIPHHRVRTRIFFTKRAIDEWIAAQEQANTPAVSLA
ncbi:helix-turn-helix domain-containing protein [Bacillaceae bacterium SIJ1]|uniref:helix-turn-helix domain-containing protein n=1 Tax=Litoribacterium kuwaitense TaxID=1398745 RepID=UPI0013ECA0B5|nr:helix-turn-helix domain-containing protein [Litoribacterium kuwaitense]NGP46014.1 helix-turn-helix domain-containing protein [Litoribacterium kuwaitense]